MVLLSAAAWDTFCIWMTFGLASPPAFVTASVSLCLTWLHDFLCTRMFSHTWHRGAGESILRWLSRRRREMKVDAVAMETQFPLCAPLCFEWRFFWWDARTNWQPPSFSRYLFFLISSFLSIVGFLSFLSSWRKRRHPL